MDTQTVLKTAQLWVDYYRQVLAERELITIESERALDDLKSRLLPVRVGMEVVWRVLPLHDADDATRLRAISHAVIMPPIIGETKEMVSQLDSDVPEELATLAAGSRRFAKAADKSAAADALEFLREYVEWGSAEGLLGTIKSLVPPAEAPEVTVAEALAPRVGLAALLRDYGRAELVTAPIAIGNSTPALDVQRLRSAITEQNPTHLLILSEGNRTAEGLLAVLAA